MNVLSKCIPRGLATGLASELKIKLTPYTEDSPRPCRAKLSFAKKTQLYKFAVQITQRKNIFFIRINFSVLFG